MTRFDVISADSHVIEPGDLWENYVDPRYRDRAPRLVHGNDEDRFVIDGRDLGSLGLMAGAGRKPEETRSAGRFDEDVPRAAWDPTARIDSIEADGVQAEVLYPTICLNMYRYTDPGFVLACMDAYNRWLVDFCGAAPDRFKGIGLISMDDIDGACRQLERIREVGLSGVMMPLRPHEDLPYSSAHYDPLWERAAALDLPVTLHLFTEATAIAGAGGAGGRPDLAQSFADWVTKPVNVQRTLAELIFSGVFDRFPTLTVISAENDIGWIGNFVARMDHRLTGKRYVMYDDPPLALMPSEYFRRNVRATFMEDRAGVLTRDLAGVTNIMWSSDFPHHESTWPESQSVFSTMFDSVPEDDKRRIVAGNVADLYHFA